MNLATVSCVAAFGVLASSGADSTTVPFSLDHDRILVRAELVGADGRCRAVTVWVDPGNPDQWVSRESGIPDRWLSMPGGLRLVLGDVVFTLAPPVETFPLAGTTIGLGLPADLNLPSSLLRRWDVLVDFPARTLTLAAPGHIRFPGSSRPAHIAPRNGLLSVEARREGRSLRMGIDLGTPVGFLSADLLADGWAVEEPSMTGAVGRSNLWGTPDEADRRVMRVRGMTLGDRTLPPFAAAVLGGESFRWLSQRADVHLDGLLGVNAFLRGRLGLDYGSGRLWVDLPSETQDLHTDVVGVVLQPEPDGRFRVLAVPEAGGAPATPELQEGDWLLAVDGVGIRGLSMGSVWDLLAGIPGRTKELLVGRDGREWTVVASVRRFLSDPR